MQTCLTCGIEYQVSECPACAGGTLPTTRQSQKELNKYSLMHVPGVFVGLVAYVVFPPLDGGPLVVLGFFALFLPMVLQLLSVLRKRLPSEVARLRKVYIYSSVALLLIALTPLLNGWLDRSPGNPVRATVIQKSTIHQRSSTGYRLTVSSWRPGRSVEELVVGLHTYNNVFVGRTVTVEVHQGFFGLAWYAGVSSR